jgi:hypothetical protein
MGRNLTLPLTLILIVTFSYAQDQPESGNLRSELADLTAALRDTRSELQQARQEIQQMHSEISAMHAQMAHDTPAAQLTPMPSLPDRVTALEEQIEVTDQRVSEHAQTKVESGSKYHVKFSGLLLFNTFSNFGSVDNTDLPNLALRRTAEFANGDFGATMRQTEFNVAVKGPDLAGAKTSGDVYFDFFGGFPNTLDGTTLGVMRFKVAHLRLDWKQTSLIVGQDKPFISPDSPTSLASLGTPAFGYSGNLWTWTPQIDVEHRWNLSQKSQFSLEGGVLDSLDGEVPPDPFERSPEAGEQSRRPAFAALASFGRDLLGRRLIVGLGGYSAQQYYGFGRNVPAWAATANWTVPINRKLELSGAFFRGRALGGMGGGVGTSVVASGRLQDPSTHVIGLNTVGGWSQLKLMATPQLEFNGAFGEDAPFANDLRTFPMGSGPAPTERNKTAMINVIDHLRSNLVVSLEYRHLMTTTLFLKQQAADHLNASFGVSF